MDKEGWLAWLKSDGTGKGYSMGAKRSEAEVQWMEGKASSGEVRGASQ
jgi:hypothetical protein